MFRNDAGVRSEDRYIVGNTGGGGGSGGGVGLASAHGSGVGPARGRTPTRADSRESWTIVQGTAPESDSATTWASPRTEATDASPTDVKTEVVAVRHVGDPNEVGIRGNEKRCLYVTLVLLLVMAIVNIGMIIYLYELLNMKMTGAGILGFEDNRVKIDGDLVLRQGLATNAFRSASSLCEQFTTRSDCDGISGCVWRSPATGDPAQCIGYFARDGITIGASGPVSLGAGPNSQLRLLPSGVVVTAASRFHVSDGDHGATGGGTLLDVNATHCTLNSATTTITGDVTVRGALEASTLTSRSDDPNGLTITSVANGIDLFAAGNVDVQAADSVTIRAPRLSFDAADSISMSAPFVTLERQALAGSAGVLCVCGAASASPGKLVVSSSGACTDVASQC